MGTWYDDEGLHWEPLWFFPWVEHAHGNRWVVPSVLVTGGHWYRWAPKVIEEMQDTQMCTVQTIQFADEREQVRHAPWRSCPPQRLRGIGGKRYDIHLHQVPRRHQ